MKQLIQRSRIVIYILLSVLALIGIIYFFWLLPIQQLQNSRHTLTQKEYFDLQNSIRGGLAQAIGGAAILIGLFFTWRNIRATERNFRIAQETAGKNLLLSQEGQITERYTRAIEQLGSDKLQIRLGGIYALERIARDSKQDHWPIMEILTAFVRSVSYVNDDSGTNGLEKPPTDVQAVLDVLCRRNLDHEAGSKMLLDLRGANLKGAYLSGCNLEKALLSKTNLAGAHIRGVHLEDANLFKASLNSAQLVASHLERAILTEVDMRNVACSNVYLEGAQLHGANLRGAKLYDSDLSGANLLESDLTEARLINSKLNGAILQGATFDLTDIKGADFSNAIGLTTVQIRGSINYSEAKLPPRIQKELADKSRDK